MAKASATESKTPSGKPEKAAKPEKAVKAAKSAKASKPAKPSIFKRLGQYFRDVRSEMKRVVWPNRTEVVNSSVVVVVTLIFFVLFTLLVDTLVVPALQLLAKIG